MNPLRVASLAGCATALLLAGIAAWLGSPIAAAALACLAGACLAADWLDCEPYPYEDDL